MKHARTPRSFKEIYRQDLNFWNWAKNKMLIGNCHVEFLKPKSKELLRDSYQAQDTCFNRYKVLCNLQAWSEYYRWTILVDHVNVFYYWAMKDNIIYINLAQGSHLGMAKRTSFIVCTSKTRLKVPWFTVVHLWTLIKSLCNKTSLILSHRAIRFAFDSYNPYVKNCFEVMKLDNKISGAISNKSIELVRHCIFELTLL